MLLYSKKNVISTQIGISQLFEKIYIYIAEQQLWYHHFRISSVYYSEAAHHRRS